MEIPIHIPGALRQYTGQESAVKCQGKNIQECLEELTRQHAELKNHLFTEEGTLRSFVNVFLNDQDIRHLDQMKTAVKAGDEINIIPSIAGG